MTGRARVNRVRVWMARRLLPAGWDLVCPMDDEEFTAYLRATMPVLDPSWIEGPRDD